ncbi:MAG TPA: fused MFS/spermidine synthase [Terriglobales bacterium]|nr:fused MFS/spermidine synthase [Terriglobales bacterium]
MDGSTATAAVRALEVPRRGATVSANPLPWWYLFFFFSGFPALLYQIVWQRALFTLYGVNIESVTMVVTAFMLGLGLGSLLGGWVSRYQQLPLLAVFGAVELLIAGYGLLSLRLFRYAADFTAGSAPFETGVVAFALVLVPTALMGSTLPILVSYTVHFSRNVGGSVGALYAANTLGSAVACFCAGLFLMRWLGQSGTVALAAGFNAVVGATVLMWQFLGRRSQRALDGEISDRSATPDSCGPSAASSIDFGIDFITALIASGVAGFVSLGYEIVWYRLFSFTTAGLAKSFAFMLGAFLAGIGFGSLATNRVCNKVTDPQSFLRILVAAVFGANLLGFLVGPILFALVVHVSYLWTLVPIGIAAACLGAVFPMLCHVSMPADARSGARMSYLYLSNILGSALGSYLTGFVLMDFLPLKQVSEILALLGLGLGAALLLKTKLARDHFAGAAFAALATALFVVIAADPLYRAMYEKMLMKDKYVSGAQFGALVETRSGVIAVTQAGTLFGGGIYDGRFNVSLVDDSNGIQRAYSLSYFHPDPKEVLMIGLSSGSWAQVLANHPQIEHLTIVEINPGYLQLIPRASDVASLLRNPKVHIEIDDGRRWLVRNADRKFDAIIMNTSYNWRSNTSNILSTDFLQLVRKHLNPGGVHAYNTTESDEVLATGLKVFPYGMRLANFMVVSDSPLQLDPKRWFDVLTHYSIDGKPEFDLTQERPRQRLMEVMSMVGTMDRNLAGPFTLESAAHIRARTSQVRIITDDNMGTEWLQ